MDDVLEAAGIVVRPARRDDVRAIHAHFAALDVRSHALLFGTGRLKPRGYVGAMVEHGLSIALDPDDHVIGHASYTVNPFRDPALDHCATFDVSVARSWRRRGVGKLLLHGIRAQARVAGVRLLVIETHRTNQPMLGWVDALGAEGLEGDDPRWRSFVIAV